jgi:flagellar biosynthesis/type III secretory pathway protein FliH
VSQLRESAFDDKELAEYDYFWDMVRLEKAFTVNAEKRSFAKGLEQGIEQGIEQGRAKGLAEGLEQGLEQGLQQGIKQGIKQGIEQGRAKERQAIAGRLKALGLSEEEIRQAMETTDN